MSEKVNQLGLIGLGVMGQGVATNLARHGYTLAIYNRSYEKTEQLVYREGQEHLKPYKSLRDFVLSLEIPRKILLLVKAGAVTDEIIQSIIPMLTPGDILVDLGNSHYKDTERREAELSKKDIRFLGTGISGGEKGALEGPAIMVGGSESAWLELKHVLNDIAAPNPEAGSCCRYFGNGGAGHFIKMVHNGIEYGYMEIISELYMLIRKYYGLSARETADVFAELSQDKSVSSYLIRITADILTKTDLESGSPLIDLISDKAGNKGTGRWTSEAALALGVSIPVLTEALFARYTSTELRSTKKIDIYLDHGQMDFQKSHLNELKKALEFGQYLCFENGLKLIREASKINDWNLNFIDILKTWENGCIIRTDFSGNIKFAYLKNPEMVSLLEDEDIASLMANDFVSAKNVMTKALACNIPMYSTSAAVNYYLAFHCAELPTVMVQAQRDFFGAHTYERIDKEGVFHTNWEE